MSFPIDFTVRRKLYYGLFDLHIDVSVWFEEVIVRTYAGKTSRMAVSSLEGELSSVISIFI